MTQPLFKRPVPSFDLDEMLLVSNSGGIFLKDSLLSCVTVDTDKSESTLEFTLAFSDPKAAHITPEMKVEFKGRDYRVRGITETLNSVSGEHELEVYCERAWYNLLYSGQVDETKLEEKTLSYVASNILHNSEWSLGTVDSSKELTATMPENTALGALQWLSSSYDLTLVIDDQTKEVNFLKEPGRDRGTYFTYTKGIKGVSKRTDTTSLITRIYGRNEEGETIASVNEGKPYLEDFSYTDEVRSAMYDFKSNISPDAMKHLLSAYLANRSKPRVSYEYEVSGLSDRENEIERFEVFDKVFVMDEDYEESVSSHITGLTIDWIDLDNSKITLGASLSTLSGSSVAGVGSSGSSGYNPSQPLSTEKPSTPKGVIAEDFGYWIKNIPWSSIRVSWEQVLTDIHGDPLNVAYYEVKLSDGKFAKVDGKDTEITFDLVEPDKAVIINVRAIADAPGGPTSDWSSNLTISPKAPTFDNYPPSAPVVKEGSGLIKISWDGNIIKEGKPSRAPEYVSEIVVEHLSSTTGWTVVDSLVTSNDTVFFPLESYEAGDRHTFRLKARDIQGRESTPSSETSIEMSEGSTRSLVNEALDKANKAIDSTNTIKEEAVTDTEILYAVSSSKTNPPSSGWKPSAPLLKENQYLWVKTVISYGLKGSSEETTPTLLSSWEKGPKGTSLSGIKPLFKVGHTRPDPPSESSYPDLSGWSEQEQVPYRGENLYRVEQISYSNGTVEYTPVTEVVLIPGPEGVPGRDGEDGTTTYTWIKYSDSESGSGMSNSPSGKDYIGLAYNKTSPVESSNPQDYTWARIRGPEGVPGAPGTDGRPSYTWIKYSDNPSGSPLYDTPRSSTKFIGIAPNKTTSRESTDSRDYTWSKFKGEDGTTTYTWIKYSDHPDGRGLYSSPKSSTKFIGLAYNKTTASSSSNPQDYTWAKLKGSDGQDGRNGSDGISVSSVVRYYQLGSSRPGNPSGTSPSGWITAEPEYTPGKSLYYSDKVTFSNGRVSWSSVQKSSSYEGIQSLQETAEEMASRLNALDLLRDNLQVNGSFEDNRAMWNRSIHRIRSESSWDGNYVAEWSDAVGYGFPSDQYLPRVTPGRLYEAKVRVRLAPGSPKPSSGKVYLRARVRGKSGNLRYIGHNISYLYVADLTEDWTTLSGIYEAKEEVYYANAFTDCGGVNFNGGKIQTDGLEFRDVTELVRLKEQVATSQETADGKNSIYWSKENDPPIGRKQGDLWYVGTVSSSARGDIVGVKIFNGSEWINYKIVADELILPGSVGNVSIADGAVTAPKIVADQALINKIMTEELMASRITGEYLSSDAIDGKTITGATIRSSASGKRTVMNSQGIEVFNSSGQSQVRLGFDIPTGLAVKDPKSGGMIEASGMIFGSYAIEPDGGIPTSWTHVPPNGTPKRIGRYRTPLRSLSKRANLMAYFGIDAEAGGSHTIDAEVFLQVHSTSYPSHINDRVLVRAKNPEKWMESSGRGGEVTLLTEHVEWSSSSAYVVLWAVNNLPSSQNRDLLVWNGQIVVMPA